MADLPDSPRHHHPFGLRAEQREHIWPAVLAIGLLASTALVAITPINDYLIMNTYIAGNHFPIGAFAVLLLLTLAVNTTLRKFASRLALSPAQLAAIWALILVTSGIPSSGMMRYFVPNMIAYHYYASAENKWDELFGPSIPEPLLISEPTAVTTFYEGLPPGMSLPWHVWLKPAAVWGIYALGLYAMMIGLSVMLRRRWVEQERFIFPLVQVPLEVANAPPADRLLNDFLRNRLVWLAVGILLVVHSLRALHTYYPAVPLIPMHSAVLFKERPLSWAGGLWFYIYPMMIGFAYLLSSEVCFSLWFFRLFYRFQLVIMGVLGLPSVRSVTFGNPKWAALQAAGGTMGLALWFVGAAREHFGNIFRKAFTGDDSIRDSDEPVGYRATVILFLGGSIVMVGWLAYFGGSLPMALVNVIVGIMVYITLAWMVTQAGLIYLEAAFSTTEIAATLTGTNSGRLQSLLVNFWNEQIFRRDLREYILPSLLNAHKICDPVNLNRSSLLTGLIAAIPLTFVASLISFIWLPYARGGALALPNPWTYQTEPLHHFKWIASLSVTPLNFSGMNVAHCVGGLLLMVSMMWMRTHLSWFALHPIGFLVSSGYPLSRIWFSAFLGWLVKGGIMRWGGYRLYRSLRPLFLGLIVGDCLSAVIWIVVGFVTKTGYQLLPG